MKRNFILVIYCLMQFTSFAQIYTPNGTYVTVNDTPEFTQWYIDYLNADTQNNYPNASIVAPASNTYNCHGWAWSVSQGGAQDWMNTPNDDKYWQDGSYVISSQTGNSKVSYQSDDHSAITTCTSDYFISKWGSLPRMYHHKNYVPYNSGNLWYFVRGCTGVPVINPTLNSQPFCGGSANICNQTVNVNLNTSCPNTSFSWVFDPAYLSSNGSLNPYGNSCNITNWGFIRIKATATNQYGSSSTWFYLNSCGQMSYSVYPNPTTEDLSVSFQDEKEANALVKEIMLIDKNGRVVQKFDNNSDEILQTKGATFNTRGLPKGTYFLHMRVGDEIKKEQILIE